MSNTVFICTPERQAEALSITLPGIGELRSIKQAVDGAPTPEALAMVMLGQISPALAPLTGILRLAEVAVSVLTAIKSIPSAITSLDPSAILVAITQLEQTMGFLTEFLPGVAYVKCVRDMLVMVEQIMRGVSTLIQNWVTQMQAISNTLKSAAILGDTQLATSGYCAQTRLIEVQQGAQVSLQDVGQILKIIKLIADIVKSVVFFDLPGISLIADTIDTLSTTLASGPGDISVDEQTRLLAISAQLSTLADQIHHLTVLVTDVVGS